MVWLIEQGIRNRFLVRVGWQYAPESSRKNQQCGLYCLRTNLSDWDEAKLWETYLMLTEEGKGD